MTISKYQREPADQELAAYCEFRCPSNAPYKVRLVHHWRGGSVTLIEQRPMQRDPRYNDQRDDWTLFWLDQNEEWNPVEELNSVHFITSLLLFMDCDPAGIFWS